MTALRSLRFSLLLPLLAATACGAAVTSAHPGRPSARRPVAQKTPLPTASAEPPEPAASAGRPTPLPGPLAEIEGDAPITLETVGHAGRFLSYCAARADSDGNGRLEVRAGAAGALSGDQLRPELAIGGRQAELIDDLLGYDAGGRFVVVRTARIVSLIDVFGGARVDLSALGFDDRDDVLQNRHHRALAFDPRGEWLAYLRQADTTTLVLRELTSGQERVLSPLPGDPWRLEWDASGEWLVVWSVVEDGNKNGRLDWPARIAKKARMACDPPVPRFSVNPEVGDRPSAVVVRRDGADARVVTDFLMPYGKDLLTRAKDGPLVLEREGKKRTIATAECGARVLHADPTRGQLLIACTNGKTPLRASVELLTPAGRLDLGVTVQPTNIDRWPGAPTRLFPLYPGSEVLLLDLERKKPLSLRPGDRVVTTSGTRALVRRAASLFFYDAETATETPLVSDTGRFANVVVDGSLVAVGSRVIDVGAGKLLGTVDGRPLALTPEGDVLVADGGAADAERLARAPLRWRKPAAPID